MKYKTLITVMGTAGFLLGTPAMVQGAELSENEAMQDQSDVEDLTNLSLTDISVTITDGIEEASAWASMDDQLTPDLESAEREVSGDAEHLEIQENLQTKEEEPIPEEESVSADESFTERAGSEETDPEETDPEETDPEETDSEEKNWEEANSEEEVSEEELSEEELSEEIEVCAEAVSSYNITKISLTQTQASVMQKVYSYLTGTMGLNKASACGILANIYVESGFSTNNMQNKYESILGYTDASYTAAVDNGSYTNFVYDRVGYGLCQWTYWTFKDDYLTTCKASGKSISDLDTQLKYLYDTMKSNGTYAKICGLPSTSAGAYRAAYLFCMSYERPSDTELKSQMRGELAETVFWKYYNGSSNLITLKNGASVSAKTSSSVTVTAKTSATTTTSSAGDYKVTASALNVRSEASMNGSVIGSLTNASKVSVISVNGTWGKISYKGKTGYVSMSYLTSVNTGNASTNVTTARPATAASIGSTYKVKADCLNIRAGNGISYSLVGSLSCGKEVTVYEVSSNNWGKILLDSSRYGWISLDYCSKVTAATAVSTTAANSSVSTGVSYKVTASALNVRTSPGTTSSVITALGRGATVKVLSISNGWGKISVNGKTGYICMTYCSKI